MDALPFELLSLIVTKYLTSVSDKLSFLLASPRHLTAFIACGRSWEKEQFCSHFQVVDLKVSSLRGIYDGLEGLSKREIVTSRYQYSIDRRRGFMGNQPGFRNSCHAKSSEWAREQITNSTFAFAFDAENFVLIHSHNGKQFCNVTVWPKCTHYQLRFEVMGQDVMLHKGLMLIMPLAKKASKYEQSTLLVYDPSTGEEKANFVLEEKRRPPNVYKESGERRLYAYKDKIVQILPSDLWKILIYSLTEQGNVVIELIKVIQLPWVDPCVIGQLFCSDQQGPHLVLAFFGEKQGASSYSTKAATLDLQGQGLDLEFISLPHRSSTINLGLPVANIHLFLAAATEYKIASHEVSITHHHHHRQRGEGQPLVIILFPDGNLMKATYDSAKKRRKHDDQLEMRSPLFEVNQEKYAISRNQWHFNELSTLDRRVLVMHKIPGIDRVVYATDLDLTLMWSVELDRGSPLHFGQRLFLYASHGLVWLSDAEGCLLLDSSEGCEKGYLKYPSYSRVLPELESLDEDTSPYAQTGFSVWSIACTSHDYVTIVHDIERCSPTIVDRIRLL